MKLLLLTFLVCTACISAPQREECPDTSHELYNLKLQYDNKELTRSEYLQLLNGRLRVLSVEECDLERWNIQQMINQVGVVK